MDVIQEEIEVWEVQFIEAEKHTMWHGSMVIGVEVVISSFLYY